MHFDIREKTISDNETRNNSAAIRLRRGLL